MVKPHSIILDEGPIKLHATSSRPLNEVSLVDQHENWFPGMLLSYSSKDMKFISWALPKKKKKISLHLFCHTLA